MQIMLGSNSNRALHKNSDPSEQKTFIFLKK